MCKVINKGDKLYYARIFPTVGIYEVCDLTVRTVTNSYFVAVDKRDKHAHLFGFNALGDTVFEDRKECLKRVQVVEANKKEINEEVYYEEY